MLALVLGLVNISMHVHVHPRVRKWSTLRCLVRPHVKEKRVSTIKLNVPHYPRPMFYDAFVTTFGDDTFCSPFNYSSVNDSAS